MTQQVAVCVCARTHACECVVLGSLSGGCGLSSWPTRGLGSTFKSQEPRPLWAAVEPLWVGGWGGAHL